MYTPPYVASAEAAGTILWIVLVAFWFMQLVFCIGFAHILQYGKRPATTTPPPPVSVIICAHNALPHLQRLLPRLAAQQYDDYEVIVIDDRSEDGSAEYLQAYALRMPNLRYRSVSSTPAGCSPKKYAQDIGIQMARAEHLLFTDADCIPKDNDWILRMLLPYTCSDAAVVLGIGQYEVRKGLLNRMIQYETLLTAIQYTNYASWGIPYMGVGRNLSFTKTAYRMAGGHHPQQHILGGDDDLLVGRMGKSMPIDWVSSAHTISLPADSWKAWYRQKTRHISTSPHYGLLHKMLLGLWAASHIGYYSLSLAMTALSAEGFPVLIGMFTAYTSVKCFIYGRNAQYLEMPLSKRWIPLLDMLYTAYLITGLPSLFLKRKTWN